MAPRFPEAKFVKNWLKALMLSPGMLFPAAYLLLYLSTNIYLNIDFKKNLYQSVSKATGNTWQVSIKSLRSSLILDSVTLNQIELTPVTRPENPGKRSCHPIIINKLEIAYPELEKLLFSRKERQRSTKALCEKILADERIYH